MISAQSQRSVCSKSSDLKLGHSIMKSQDFFYLDIWQSEDCMSKGTSHEACAKLELTTETDHYLNPQLLP